MVDKLLTLNPEIALLVAGVVCLFMGLAPSWVARGTVRGVAILALVIAGYLALSDACAAADPDYNDITATPLANYTKVALSGIGILLLMLFGRVSKDLGGPERDSLGVESKFDPGSAMRGEFVAFFLFSLTGAMLCAGADDLVWLFLALELTSLPTYVMAATASSRPQAQEAAVKYFFLGALAAAVFLYGFALIYGATGATDYATITAYLAQLQDNGLAEAGRDGNTTLFVAGLVLAVVGVSFKIAAAPMHLYAADVYEGSATPVTAFLAFVPKTAGFVSLIGLMGLAAPLTDAVRLPITCTLWLMAAVTMTVGNALGVMQTNVKRVLAYSSIAHSGYMLVGLLAFPKASATPNMTSAIGDGAAAILFYLVAYALATLGVFGVMICLERDGQENGKEIETYDDLSGLARRHPALGAIMLACVLSLLGLPPLVGFLGKIYLFGSAVQEGYVGLVVIAVLNSAVSAVYYLRIASACFFSEPNPRVRWAGTPAACCSAAIAAAVALVLGVAGNWLVVAAKNTTNTQFAAAQQPVRFTHAEISTAPSRNN